MSTKKCTTCKKTYDLSHFAGSNARGEYSFKKCKKCRNRAKNTNKSDNPYSYLRHIFTQLKYSRRKKDPGLDWKIEVDNLIEAWDKQEGKCALTGLYMTYHKDGTGKKDLNVSVDRIDPEIGYLPYNTQLVCNRVNTLKHVLSEDELYWWCKNIVSYKEE